MERLRQLKIDLTNDPAISLLGIHPKEVKSAYEKLPTNPVFIATQSTLVKTWKQPRCPSKKGMDKETMIHLFHGILLSH